MSTTDPILLNIEFGHKVDPDTKAVTLYVCNQPWGPVITGNTFAEAKTKMVEAITANMVAHSFCEIVERNDDHMDLTEISEANEADKANKAKALIGSSKDIISRVRKELDRTLEACA